MANLTLAQINAALDAACQTALATWDAHASDNTKPALQKSAPQKIGDNATLCTDLYTGPKGSGFVVTALVDLKFRKLVIAKQAGPETHREKPSPTLAQLTVECQQERARRYDKFASVYDLADAETKMTSSDPAVQSAGAAQKSAVLQKRLQIKADNPKPQ